MLQVRYYQILVVNASLSFGISNTNVTKCGTGIVDDDFIRIDGTTMEGRSASEVLSAYWCKCSSR